MSEYDVCFTYEKGGAFNDESMNLLFNSTLMFILTLAVMKDLDWVITLKQLP